MASAARAERRGPAGRRPAELVAQVCDCSFTRFLSAAIRGDEVVLVRPFGRPEFRRRDAEQPIGRPVRLRLEKRERRGEEAGRKLRRLEAAAAAGAEAEIGQP